METIVVGYDGSDAARRALGRTAALAAGGAKVIVLHATPSLYRGVYEVADTEEERRGAVLLEEARELLGKRGIDVEIRTAVGDAAEKLISAAREAGAGIIVVGRRRSTLAHVLGSVSSKVVAEAPCDVLVVR